jgi:hypothetical protein
VIGYVITAHPSDYPDKYVVRAHHWAGLEHLVSLTPEAVVDSLEEARREVPPGLLRVPRYVEDDPVIVEWWL